MANKRLSTRSPHGDILGQAPNFCANGGTEERYILLISQDSPTTLQNFRNRQLSGTWDQNEMIRGKTASPPATRLAVPAEKRGQAPILTEPYAKDGLDVPF